MKLLQPPEYQATAARTFAAVREKVLRLLPSADVEHVGSSSVPGMLSKGDLDICVLVDSDGHAMAVEVLQAAGYAIKVDTLRTDQLCMLESTEATQVTADHALQVVARGSKFEFFVEFRDALLRDRTLVARYNEIKQQHAGASAAEYRTAKAAFIELVLDRG